MLKRMSALLLSASLISAQFVAVSAENPNNRTASAIINIINPTVTILSAKEVTQSSVFSTLRRSVKRVANQTESIEGFIEKKYEVELLHEDGTITTEIISIFEEISEEISEE